MKFALLQRHAVKVAAGLFLLSGILFVNPIDGMAASKNAEVQTRSSYMVTIAAPAVEVHLSANEHSRSVGEVKRGQTYEVLSNLGNGWVKISTGNGDGYIKTSGKASLVEALLNEKTAVEDIMTQAIEAENTKDTSKSVSGRAENLRGSSVTQILYYINENHLVLAVTGDSSALLLTGYDTKNVSVYDSVTSETTTMAIADAQEYFEAYDCAFFAWIK